MPSSLSLAGGPTRAMRVPAPAWRQPFWPPRSGTRLGALRAPFQLPSGPAGPCDHPRDGVCAPTWIGTTPNSGKSRALDPPRAGYSQVSPGRRRKLDLCQTTTILDSANYYCLAGGDGRSAAGRSAGYWNGTRCGSDAGAELSPASPSRACETYPTRLARLRDIPDVMDGLSPDPSTCARRFLCAGGPFFASFGAVASEDPRRRGPQQRGAGHCRSLSPP